MCNGYVISEVEPVNDTVEFREQLASAWRTTLDAAIERGAPPQVAIETMAAVAHTRFAESFGPLAAANYLQLLAEQLRDVDREETTTLIRGEQPEPHIPEGVVSLDLGWPLRDGLLD